MKLEEIINKHYKQLHENDFHILKYILNHRNTCYELGINSLAEKCNVSRSSVLRLAQKLGFQGYSEFRIFLKWQVQDSRLQEKSNVESLNLDIQETLKYANAKDFHDLCELIDQKERIFIYGTGTVQLNCADELQRMFLAVHKHLHVVRAQREFQLVLSNVTDSDLVIIISFSGDTPAIFPDVQSLVTKGVSFVSITNLKNNRLARMTPYNLYAHSTETELANGVTTASFSSFFLIGEALFRHYADYQYRRQAELLHTQPSADKK